MLSPNFSGRFFKFSMVHVKVVLTPSPKVVLHHWFCCSPTSSSISNYIGTSVSFNLVVQTLISSYTISEIAIDISFKYIIKCPVLHKLHITQPQSMKHAYQCTIKSNSGSGAKCSEEDEGQNRYFKP